MCIAPNIKIPEIPKPEPIPTPVSEDVIRSMEERRTKLRRKAGFAGTILNKRLDETEPQGIKKTLLGQ